MTLKEKLEKEREHIIWFYTRNKKKEFDENAVKFLQGYDHCIKCIENWEKNNDTP